MPLAGEASAPLIVDVFSARLIREGSVKLAIGNHKRDCFYRENNHFAKAPRFCILDLVVLFQRIRRIDHPPNTIIDWSAFEPGNRSSNK